MEDSLTPDFAAFEKPDMNYFRKRAEHPEETTAQDLLVHLQDARVYKHESKHATDDVTGMTDDVSLKEEVSLQVADDVNSGSDYDTDIELPSNNSRKVITTKYGAGGILT